MRRLFLGSALAVALTIGAHGTSLASTMVPVAPDFHAQVTGAIQLMNDNELSNQSGNDDSGDDSNGGNSSNGSD